MMMKVAMRRFKLKFFLTSDPPYRAGHLAREVCAFFPLTVLARWSDFPRQTVLIGQGGTSSLPSIFPFRTFRLLFSSSSDIDWAPPFDA